MAMKSFDKPIASQLLEEAANAYIRAAEAPIDPESPIQLPTDSDLDELSASAIDLLAIATAVDAKQPFDIAAAGLRSIGGREDRLFGHKQSVCQSRMLQEIEKRNELFSVLIIE